MVFVDSHGYPKALKSLITALNISDIAVLCVPPDGLDRNNPASVHTGECIVALDLLGFKHAGFAECQFLLSLKEKRKEKLLFLIQCPQ